MQRAEVGPDDPGYQLAKNLSLTLQDAEVRKFIQDQAVRQFDGDYDILLAKAQHESLSSSNARGSKTFGQLLSGGNANARGQELDLDKILAENPLLQIAVPELPEASAETWNAKEYSPIVVYRIPGVDLNKVTHLPAFDSKGNVFNFNITEIPTHPIIVISYNERLTAVPKGKSPESVINARVACSTPSPYYTDANYNYYFTPDLYCSGEPGPIGPGTGGGTGGGTTTCDRDRKSTYDYVHKIKFNTMKWFLKAEAYVDGNPELFVLVVHGSKNPSGFNDIRKYINSRDRSKWKDCGVFDCDPEWIVANQEIFDWTKEDFGNLARYDWFEEDASGDKVTYSISFTTNFGENDSESVTGKVDVVINSNDRNLGNSYIKYCDNTDGVGEDYDTGQIIFHVNQP